MEKINLPFLSEDHNNQINNKQSSYNLLPSISLDKYNEGPFIKSEKLSPTRLTDKLEQNTLNKDSGLITHSNLQESYNERETSLYDLLFNTSKRIPHQKIKIQYNPQYTNLRYNVLPQAGISLEVKTGITADNIAEFAYPLAQFVEQVRPDYIIACDRGARIVGLAVHMLYGRLYGALPTQDHSIHFRKISRKVPEDAVREVLRPDVQRMLTVVDSPTVLVLDDWVATGGTKSLVRELFAELSGGRANILYGVMRGDGADVTGGRDSAAFGDWHDNANLIGVDYDSSDLKPFRVGSSAASVYRRRMSVNIDNFVKGLSPII